MNTKQHAFDFSSYDKAVFLGYATYKALRATVLTGSYFKLETLDNYAFNHFGQLAGRKAISFALTKALGHIVGKETPCHNLTGLVQSSIKELVQQFLNATPETQIAVHEHITRAIAAYFIVHGENAWSDLEQITHIDAFLSQKGLSSEKFIGGDWVRSVVKLILRFLIDLYIVQPHKDHIHGWTMPVTLLRNSVIGAQYINQGLGFHGLVPTAITASLGFTAMSMTSPLLSALGMAIGNDPQISAAIMGLNTAWVLSSYLSLPMLGAAGAVCGLMQLKHKYPDEWQNLCTHIQGLADLVKNPSLTLNPDAISDDWLAAHTSRIRDLDTYQPKNDIEALYSFAQHDILDKEQQAQEELFAAQTMMFHLDEKIKSLSQEAQSNGLSDQARNCLNDSSIGLQDAYWTLKRQESHLVETINQLHQTAEFKFIQAQGLVHNTGMQVYILDKQEAHIENLQVAFATQLADKKSIEDEQKVLRDHLMTLLDIEMSLQTQQPLTQAQVQAQQKAKKDLSLASIDELLQRIATTQANITSLIVQKKAACADEVEASKQQLAAEKTAYVAELKTRAEAFLAALPHLKQGESTLLPLDLYKKMLILAVGIHQGHIQISQADSALDQLKDNIEHLRQDPLLADQADAFDEGRLKIQYQILFPLGKKARYNNDVRMDDQSQSMQVDIRATSLSYVESVPTVDELDVIPQKDLANDIHHRIEESFYQPLTAEDLNYDQTINQSVQNLFDQRIPIVLPQADKGQSLIQAYEAQTHTHESESYSSYAKRACIKAIPRADVRLRAGWVMDEIVAQACAASFSSKCFKSRHSSDDQVYFKKENQYLRIQNPTTPAYAFHISQPNEHKLYITITNKWIVDGYTLSLSAQGNDDFHPLAEGKSNYIETQHLFELDIPDRPTPPPSPKTGWTASLQSFMSKAAQSIGVSSPQRIDLNQMDFNVGQPVNPEDKHIVYDNFRLTLSDIGVVMKIEDTISVNQSQ